MTRISKQTVRVRNSASKPATGKQALTKALGRKLGVTIAQLEKSFGWQPHTARAAISRLRKEGLCVQRSDGDKGAVYRIVKDGGNHASR